MIEKYKFVAVYLNGKLDDWFTVPVSAVCFEQSQALANGFTMEVSRGTFKTDTAAAKAANKRYAS